MRPAEGLRRIAARSDVQTAWIVAAVMLCAVLIPGALLYAYSAMESLEESDLWFDFVLRVAVRDVEERGVEALAFEDWRGRIPGPAAALRLRAPSGELLAERGVWPPAEHAIAARRQDQKVHSRSLGSAWLLRRGTWLVGEKTAASGAQVELALPVDHFARESAEIRQRVLVGSGIATALVLIAALGATARAFLPLRRATAELREVNTGRLGLRLPSRGTGDPIDVHAETLNRVLAELDAGFARLRAFSSDAAHELRTPLNRIATVTEVALLEGGERELRAALESVERTAGELARVVQSLLLLAEIDERRFSPRREAIDVGRWLQRNASVYAPSFEDADVKLVVHGDAAVIAGDETLLDRVLANLLDNALTHAPPGTCVEVGASRRGEGVRITVDDAGSGIPPADRERVFDRFGLRIGERRPGHGLGLALARAIAVLHGGSLRADAPPSGGGARLELWLPTADTKRA